MLEELKISEVDIATLSPKPKSYIVSPLEDKTLLQLSPEAFKEKKAAALHDLIDDLNATQGDIDKIYTIFRQVKDAEYGMLRYRREYITDNAYGDTDSYRIAIRDICYKLINSTPEFNSDGISRNNYQKKTYHQYEQTREILEYAWRFRLFDTDMYRIYIAKIKPIALGLFKDALSQQTTLADVLRYFALIKIPNNILRVHTVNLFSNHGATNSYKHALLTIAETAMKFPSYNSKHDRPQLLQLLNELKEQEPHFDKGWQELIANLKTFINTKATNDVSSQFGQDIKVKIFK